VRWWERVAAWDVTHRLAVDAAGAVVLGLLVVPVSTGVLGMPTRAAAVLWSLALVAPLPWRRVRPAASAAAVYAVALAHVVVGTPLVLPADLLVLVALYSVTVHGPTWAYRTAAGTAPVGAAAVGLGTMARFGWGPRDAAFIAFVIVLMCVTVFAVALVRRSRRVAIDALVDRARRLEIERDQQARIATAAERARIAREMHDIVAHSLSVIIAQADGGRYAAATDPDAAGRALTTVAETGRAALADMRRLLGVLRPTEASDAGPTGSAGSSPGAAAGAPSAGGGTVAAGGLSPQPGVEDVAALVAQARESGVRASLVRMGTPRTLPPGTGLTVYRICQESLTNVLKHAGPSPTVTVLLQWGAASLVLEVSDDGRGAAAASDGHGQGLLGMRERAVMLGGTLAAGPRPGGGYRVRAEIPIPPLRPEEDAP